MHSPSKAYLGAEGAYVSPEQKRREAEATGSGGGGAGASPPGRDGSGSGSGSGIGSATATAASLPPGAGDSGVQRRLHMEHLDEPTAVMFGQGGSSTPPYSGMALNHGNNSFKGSYNAYSSTNISTYNTSGRKGFSAAFVWCLKVVNFLLSLGIWVTVIGIVLLFWYVKSTEQKHVFLMRLTSMNGIGAFGTGGADMTAGAGGIGGGGGAAAAMGLHLQDRGGFVAGMWQRLLGLCGIQL